MLMNLSKLPIPSYRFAVNCTLLFLFHLLILFQSALSLLPNLDGLTTMLNEEVNLFRSLLLPFRLPPSCDLASPCTDNELHAEMLRLNASEIVE